MVGRRGHVQAAFTVKELRELTKLDGVTFFVAPESLEAGVNAASEIELKERVKQEQVAGGLCRRNQLTVRTARPLSCSFAWPIEILPERTIRLVLVV